MTEHCRPNVKIIFARGRGGAREAKDPGWELVDVVPRGWGYWI